MTPRQIFALLKEAATSWSEDSAPSMGAAISYYSVFSMAPLLVIVIAVAGFFFGADQVQGALSAQLTSLMGEDAARAVDEMLKNAQQPRTGGIAAITSIGVLVIGATTVLAELQNALDRIWRVPAREKENGLWRWAMIFKFLPRAHIRWHDVWIGAAVTSVLFALGKFLIALYLGKSDVASGFGLFGSLALMMVWIYYSAQIFLFGAEFTWVFANRYGSRQRDRAGENAQRRRSAATSGGRGIGATAP